jgi:YHYH protein
MHRFLAISLGAAGVALAFHVSSAAAHEMLDGYEISEALETFLHAVDPKAVLQPAKVVDCTLSGGTKTKCAKIILQPKPKRTGPWCPDFVSDGPEAGGFWIKDGKVFDVDGAFVKNLAEFYKNPKWKLYDPKTGKIKVTHSFEACFAAARPNVPLDYYDYCAQCEVDQVVTTTAVTYFIPIEPVVAAETSPLHEQPGAGVALNGVKLNGPAPYDDIVKARNIAPFDHCGGHANPYHGYHYHFVTDCAPIATEIEGHAPLIGISLDGYGIFRRLDGLGNEPKGLDKCGGHTVEGIGYHYHASPVGTNSIIGCFKAEIGCASPPGTATCDATKAHQPLAAPGMGPPPGAGPPPKDG